MFLMSLTDRLGQEAEIFEIEVDHIMFKVGKEGWDTWKRGAKTSSVKMITG